jgi:hypothetical protein
MMSRKLHFSALRVCLAAFLLCAGSLFAQAPSFITFDAPGAGREGGQGTTATCVNSDGVVAGFYFDRGGFSHGFVRAVNGVISEFLPSRLTSTSVMSINKRGDIVGFGTAGHGTQGFLRAANGQITYILASGAFSTEPASINDSGQIAGTISDIRGVVHAFIRDADGSFTVFDDPSASGPHGISTEAVAINNAGVVTGFYHDTNSGMLRGFIRDQFGNFTNFDGGAGSVKTSPAGINVGGEVAGSYGETAHLILHGFLRDAAGDIINFDVPDATFTEPVAVNDSGTIVGQWGTPQNLIYGFVRDASGNVTTFSVPVANIGTLPMAINQAGRIVGRYSDANGVNHAFLR